MIIRNNLSCNMDEWSNSCRSCLKKAELFSHFIYEHVSADEYFYCTSVEVKRDDELPKAVCGDCYNLINKFSEFKTRCIQSENKLLGLSKGALVKDEPSSDIEVKNEMEEEDAWEENSEDKNRTASCSLLEIKVQAAKEDVTEEVLSDINVTGSDAPETLGGEDFEDHNEATKVSATKVANPTARNILPKNFKCELCNRKFAFKERLEGHILRHAGKTTMEKSKKSREEILEAKRKASKERYMKIKCDPMLNERRKKKDKESYIKNKTNKQYLKINERSVQEQTNQREKWRLHSSKYYEKKKEKQVLEVNVDENITEPKAAKAEETPGEADPLQLESKEKQPKVKTLSNVKGPIECKECHKTFTAWETLRRHIESCHSRLSFKDVTCQVCSKVCKTSDTLRVHLRTHKERRGRVCDECGKTFKSNVTFKNHLETHTYRTQNYPCAHCGKKYINKKTRERHISRRHTNKQFICSYCAYVFTDKANLIRHIMIHENRHPKYKCDVCSRSLTSQASLTVHKRMHTGEKPFSCSHCSMRFSKRAWLVEHERNHTGEKPFQCSVCELSFSRRGSMRRHMKVHNMWEGCKRKSRGGP